MDIYPVAFIIIIVQEKQTMDPSLESDIPSGVNVACHFNVSGFSGEFDIAISGCQVTEYFNMTISGLQGQFSSRFTPRHDISCYFNVTVADSLKLTEHTIFAQYQDSVFSPQTVYTQNIRAFSRHADGCSTVKDTQRTVEESTSHCSDERIGRQNYLFSCIQIGSSVIRIVAGKETIIGIQAKSIPGIQGTQPQPTLVIQIFDKHIAVRSRRQQVAGQFHSQIFILGADIFDTTVHNQVFR